MATVKLDRLTLTKRALWAMTGLGASVAAARLLFGLGATTNLSDAFPWGLWIGFDVMGGVALAAGGFVITATVYIFQRHQYHPVLKPAILTAFLGYLAVIAGLIFDLGVPWNIWRPIVNWQHHSVLFEVAWCVMLYTTVLALEFSPEALDPSSRYGRVRQVLLKARFPLVVVGIGLSTLHQSSLGSLFLIMPYRMHPLWYSPLLPVSFFVSAVGLGLLMVMLESLVTSFLYRRPVEVRLLAGLGLAARWVLVAYLALRLGDLAVRGEMAGMFSKDWRVFLFWSEISLAVLIPAVLLSMPGVRRRVGGLVGAAVSGVCGWVLNRISVSGLAHIRPDAPIYVPSLAELALSAGIVSAAGLAFLFAVEHLRLWEAPVVERRTERPYDNWRRAWAMFSTAGLVRNLRIDHSLWLMLAAAVGFAFVPDEPLVRRGVPPSPVHRARGADTLWIDGNLDGYGAWFTHRRHMKGCFRGTECLDCHTPDQTAAAALSEDSWNSPNCAHCHHMNLPRDRNTACATCHRDMYAPTDAFGHNWHASPSGANLSCAKCHPVGQERRSDTAKPCTACHLDLTPEGSHIPFQRHLAPAYVDAMHQLCINCHHMKADMFGDPDLARCVKCHPGRRELVDAADLTVRFSRPTGKRVVVPMLK